MGVTLQCCTLLQAVEGLAECEYHTQPEPALATIIDAEGMSIRKAVRLHQCGTRRQFSALEPMLLREGIMRIGHIGKSQVRIVEARPAVERALQIVKKDRFALCAAGAGA